MSVFCFMFFNYISLSSYSLSYLSISSFFLFWIFAICLSLSFSFLIISSFLWWSIELTSWFAFIIAFLFASLSSSSYIYCWDCELVFCLINYLESLSCSTVASLWAICFIKWSWFILFLTLFSNSCRYACT